MNENDQGSKESDNFSFGGSGVYDDEVAAANAPRNYDAHEPVNANARYSNKSSYHEQNNAIDERSSWESA